MARRFSGRLRRPLRLEGFSVLSRVLRHAVYSQDAPPTQSAFWILLHDLRSAVDHERLDWLYNDRLHVRLGGKDVVVGADMRNAQFIGADHSVSHFALGYEPDIGLAVDVLVPDDGVLIDVGSNWGYFPIYLAARPGFQGRILALEPFPKSFAGLERALAELGLQSRVEALPLAAGREPGMVAMTDEIFSGNNRVIEGDAGITVQRTTIDELVRERGLKHLDFLKIDVEGAEAEVIAGARTTIESFGPAVMFEDWIGDFANQGAFEEISKIANYRFYVLNVMPSLRPKADKDGASEPALVDCLVDVSEVTAKDRDKWPDRINVLALPADRELETRLAAWELRPTQA